MSERFPWSRSQKFKLSARGEEAVASYELAVAEAQTGNGQASFEAARLRWAQPWALRPEDLLFLTEFGQKGKTIAEAAAALETCGETPVRVKEAATQLLASGFLVAATLTIG